MTRLLVVSDLHLELGPRASHDPYREPHLVPDADVAIVAGDVHKPVERAIAYLRETIARRMPVVFVPGNHEYYGRNLDAELAIGREHASIRRDDCNDVHLLDEDEDEVEIAGVRFVGATLWTDYALHVGDLEGNARDIEIMKAMGAAEAVINDHRRIRTREVNGVSRRLTPSHARRRHERSRAYIESVLSQPFGGPTVVVTHHAPHLGSVEGRFQGDAVTPAFVSDLGDVIAQHQPELWVHGHVHSSHDYRVGGTRIVANTAGYVFDGRLENGAFEPSLVIEVPS